MSEFINTKLKSRLFSAAFLPTGPRPQTKGECDGVNQLLDAGIIKDIEEFYLQKERETNT